MKKRIAAILLTLALALTLLPAAALAVDFFPLEKKGNFTNFSTTFIAGDKLQVSIITQDEDGWHGVHGIADLNGDLIVPVEYDQLIEYQDGVFYCQNRENGYTDFYDDAGKLLIRVEHDKNGSAQPLKGSEGNTQFYVFFKDGKQGAVTTTGVLVAPAIYSNVEDGGKGVLLVQKDGRTGAISAKGEVIVPIGDYHSISRFRNGYASYARILEEQEDPWGEIRYTTVSGILDMTGKSVMELESGDVIEVAGLDTAFAVIRGRFEDDEYIGGYRVIDKAGNTVYGPVNKQFYLTDEGTVWTQDTYDSFTLKDFTGKTLTSYTYSCKDPSYGYSITARLREAPYELWRDGRPAVVEANGKESSWGDESTALIRKVEGDKYGCVNAAGDVIVPFEYDYIGDFHENMATIEVDGLWGYINGKGEVVCTPQYLACLNFEDGLGVVYDEDEKCGCVDKTGKVVIPVIYDDTTAYHFSKGLLPVKQGDKYGYINAKNEWVIEPVYEMAYSYNDGCMAAVRYEGKSGFITHPVLKAVKSVGNDPARKGGTAQQSTQTVTIGDKTVELQAYAIPGPNGATNYVKIRDVAAALDGTAAQFNVGWVSGAVNIEKGKAYTSRNGQENQTPYSGDMTYAVNTADTRIDGYVADLTAFVIKDSSGRGSTYYKLRDLGQALGFNVGWTKARGMFLEPDKAYTSAD